MSLQIWLWYAFLFTMQFFQNAMRFRNSWILHDEKVPKLISCKVPHRKETQFIKILKRICRNMQEKNSMLHAIPGGVTSIYTGRGRAIFWGAFFRAGNKFWGIIFGKIIGVSFSASPIMDPSLGIYFQHELNSRVYTLYGI